MNTDNLSEKIEPYLMLFVVVISLICIIFMPALTALIAFLIVPAFIYLKKINKYIPYVLIFTTLIAMYALGKTIYIPLVLPALFLNTLASEVVLRDSIKNKRLQILMLIAFNIISMFLSIYIYTKTVGITLIDLAGRVKDFQINLIELSVKMKTADESQANDVLKILKETAGIEEFIGLVTSTVMSLSFISGFIQAKLLWWIKDRRENTKNDIELNRYKISPFTILTLSFLVLIGLTLARNGYTGGKVLADTFYDVLILSSIFNLYCALLSFFSKRGLKVRSYIMALIALLLISEIALPFTIFDSVFDFRNTTGRSLYEYIKYKFFKKGGK